MVWSQYVYEATNGFDPDVSDDDEFNDEHTPLNIEDWEVEYSDELHHMWNTMNTLLYDARLEHTGKFCDFVEFCYVEHESCHEREYDDELYHIWKNVRRIINDNGLYGEMMRGATFNDFSNFAKNYMCIH
jgi:hypothetical protein|tara:strand:- start:1607 stop:1996 length:390 start_codon:yes stop_codon:yes gene_type:complete